MTARRIAGLVALACALALSLHAQTLAPPGLLAAYAMSNGTDASGNNRTATLTNTTTVPGRYSNALRFNGTSSRMTVPTFNVSTAFTLEAWINAAAVSRGAVGQRSAAGGWSAIIYKGLDDVFLAEVGGFLTGGFTKVGGALVQILSPTALSANGWHHVAVTYDGKAMALVYDGIQVANIPATGDVLGSTEPIEIGGSAKDGGYANGTIDDVRIYNRALTLAELATDMNTAIDTPVEPVDSWDVQVWPKGVDPAQGGAVAAGNFPKAGATCGLAPAPVPPVPVTVQNPTHLRLSDPGATGKECEITAQTFFAGVPLGTGYTSTAAAKSTSGLASAKSPPSNPFDRVAVAIAPDAPGKPAVIAK